MRRNENECVGCPPDLGCIGEACKYRNVERVYCDLCGDEAEYIVDDEELCEDCAKKYLQQSFDELLVDEKAKALGISIETIL